MVDGEWRDLRKIIEPIKIKGKDTLDFEISLTHRGPVMDFDLIAHSAASIFHGKIPKLEFDAQYSYGWAGRNMPHDSSLSTFLSLGLATEVKEAMEASKGAFNYIRGEREQD